MMIARFILGCLGVFAMIQPAYAEKWPTTEFVFEKTDPYSSVPSFLNPFSGFSSAEKKVIADYEAYLSEVAVYYEKLGFKAPPLERTKGRKGGNAYRVYFFDYDDDDPIARASYSENGRITLQVDYSRAIVKGKPVDRTYEDLAHELFHNIQRGYQLSYELDHGNWIMEGQAQALGMDAAWRLRKIDVYKGKQDGYRLGGRRYYEPLPATDTQKSYRTASFWRYLGEQHAASKHNARPGVAVLLPDYSYLVEVFDNPFGGPVSANGDMMWLDEGLRKATGIGLARHYASFTSTFAAYVPARLTAEPTTSAQQAEDNWLNFIFGTCPTISLSPGKPSGDARLDLRKNASRCFKAEVTGEGNADISIHVRGETIAALKALYVGTSGGDRVGGVQIVPSPAGGGYLGHWRFRIAGGEPQVFIISNMADNPALTKNFPVTVNVTTSRWESSMTSPRPQKSASNSSQQKAASAAAAPSSSNPGFRDPSREAAQAELAAGLKSLSNQTALGSHASFERRRAPCQKDFALTGCGPLTSIQLELTPGAIGDLTQTTGTGGGLGQVMSQFTAIADNGAFRTDRDWKAAMQEAKDSEGSSVGITMPLIEYGFTGSFDNAAIVVNGGKGSGNYQALGPQDSQIGRGRAFRQSGKVTIEEFTPYVMRGSFSANLTDMSRVEFTEEDVDPTLPIHRTISGRFVIAAPWEGDPQFADYVPTSVDSGMQDLAQAFPGVGNGDVSDLMTQKTPAGSGGTLGAFPTCDCGCEPLETYSAVCQPVCKVKYMQCHWQAAASMDYDIRKKERDALEADVDMMREDLKRFVREQNKMDQEEAYLQLFDEQETAEDKRRILMSYGMNVGKYGDDETQRAAANPHIQTRDEYIAGLKEQDLPQKTIDHLIGLMDEAMEEVGGWPEPQ